jgi:hypothetical protein
MRSSNGSTAAGKPGVRNEHHGVRRRPRTGDGRTQAGEQRDGRAEAEAIAPQEPIGAETPRGFTRWLEGIRVRGDKDDEFRGTIADIVEHKPRPSKAGELSILIERARLRLETLRDDLALTLALFEEGRKANRDLRHRYLEPGMLSNDETVNERWSGGAESVCHVGRAVGELSGEVWETGKAVAGFADSPGCGRLEGLAAVLRQSRVIFVDFPEAHDERWAHADECRELIAEATIFIQLLKQMRMAEPR